MSNTPTPTELPEDIKKEIDLESKDYANKRYKYRLYPNEWMAAYNAHHAGATAMYEKLKAASQPIGAVWVKATEFKIEYRPDHNASPNYYARWMGGTIKATGWFHKADGTFFWNVSGYIPILKSEYEHLEILDESTPSKESDAVAFLEWVVKMGYRTEKGTWYIPSDELPTQITTSQLYQQFKAQCRKS